VNEAFAMRAPFGSPLLLVRLMLAAALPVAIAACAPAPLYKAGPEIVDATPDQIAGSPNNFPQAQVIWGGEVIGVQNLADHTRIEVLAYPLDSSQRPRLKEPATGRFMAEVPGFLEPMNFPKGSLITVRGQFTGTQAEPVGQARYVYPMVFVRNGDFHRWTPEEMRQGHPNISFGVGVGVIR
jgi:outer membrane lipoprotein